MIKKTYFLTLITAIGCGSSPHSSPSATIADLANSLRQERYEDAYHSMSRTYQEQVPFKQFERKLKARREYTLQTAAYLEKTLHGAAERVQVRLEDGSTLELVYERGGWHFADNIVDYYDRSSPRAALRTFIRAIQHRRYDILIQLMPAADRQGVNPKKMKEAWVSQTKTEADRLALRLQRAISSPIEINGRHATMIYEQGATVRFFRERDGWTIQSPE